MKKKIVFATLLLTSLSLSACNNTKAQPTNSTNQSTNYSDLKHEITYVDLDSIPSGSELLETTNSTLDSINVPNIDGFIDYDLTDDGSSQMINAILQINDSKLNISALRLTFPDEGEWIIMSISEYDSDPIKYYYGIESIIDHIDIYNFNTGEIISSKKSDINTDEIMSEYQEESDKIMQDFNNALDDIAEQYGIDTNP